MALIKILNAFADKMFFQGFLILWSKSKCLLLFLLCISFCPQCLILKSKGNFLKLFFNAQTSVNIIDLSYAVSNISPMPLMAFLILKGQK